MPIHYDSMGKTKHSIVYSLNKNNMSRHCPIRNCPIRFLSLAGKYLLVSRCVEKHETRQSLTLFVSHRNMIYIIHFCSIRFGLHLGWFGLIMINLVCFSHLIFSIHHVTYLSTSECVPFFGQGSLKTRAFTVYQGNNECSYFCLSRTFRCIRFGLLPGWANVG